ncbi:MAG TPA: class I SAM-dependent methyltransferase [Nitrospirae bacterium]|nr:class I SAM-dependent methyltransferase [Nitrospirota bacterium]
MINMYRSAGGDGVGVDVYQWDGVDMVLINTKKLPFEKASFDTVTFVDSLNHITYRPAILKEVRRVLKPEGLLLITNLSPLISLLWHKWAFWDKDQHERGMEEEEIYGFRKRELVELLSGCGFRVNKIERFAWKINQLYICSPE